MLVKVKPRHEPWSVILDDGSFGIFKEDASVIVERIADTSFARNSTLDPHSIGDEDWLEWTRLVSRLMLQKCIAVDSNIRSGVPVLRGTRISISQIFGELATADCIFELADEYDIDPKSITEMLEGMAIQFDRPFLK